MLTVLSPIRELMSDDFNFNADQPLRVLRALRKPNGVSKEVWDEFTKLRRYSWTDEEKESIFTLWRLG